jgi:flagellar hook-associated protein 1 FlgK
MAPSFGSYEIARSGLMANERGLYVTGHNISNVNTPGYVRQQVIMTEKVGAAKYGKSGIYQLGLGADIQQIRQIRHAFLDNLYRQENMNLGYWEARNKTLRDIEVILGEPMGEGLQSAINQFYDAWHELSKEPESLTVRALLVQKAESLVNQINHIGEQISRLQGDIDSEIRVRIDEVNSITGQIAELNLQIAKYEINGDTANDYRDMRNNLIDRLTKLIDADVTELQDGHVNITSGGYFLVQRGEYTKILLDREGPGEVFHNPILEDSGIELPLSNGIIKGLLESRGEVSGRLGSIENGTPNVKSHISYIIDVSDSNGLNLEKIKEKIINDVQYMEGAGIDFNITLVTTCQNTIISKESYDKDAYNSFIQDLSLVNQHTAEYTDDFTGVFTELGNIDFRNDDNKYAVVFTNDSVDAAEANSYNAILGAMGMKAHIVTGAGSGWEQVAETTGGNVYDEGINEGTIGTNIKKDINSSISRVEETGNILPDLRKQINALINIMAREINSLHRSGKTMGIPPKDGEDFFVSINPNYPLEMGNIKLNDNLIDLNNIVASASEDIGDNTIALEIANLKNKSLIEDLTGELSISEYYQSIILKVGYNSSDASRITDSQRKLVRSADINRQSIAGVSMDEEMTNMMKYKYAYNAASKAINVIDEMLESLITRMGIVGR